MKFGSSNQEASSSAGKNKGKVLVPCHAWKCTPITISGGVDIFEVSEYHLLLQVSSHWGSQKLLQGLVSHKFAAYLSILNYLPYS